MGRHSGHMKNRELFEPVSEKTGTELYHLPGKDRR